MTTCTLIITDEVNCKLSNLELRERKDLVNRFKYDIPGAKYMPAVRLGRWDGKAAFCQLSGQTFINLLPEIIPFLISRGYDIAIDDQRDYKMQIDLGTIDQNTFSDKVWPDKHIMAGQPVVLRDYQITIVNKFLENQQSIQEIATGAGKCLSYDTELTLVLGKNTEFNGFLGSSKVKVGKLIESIAAYKSTNLERNREIDVLALDISIPTPSGNTAINYVIMKDGLSGNTILMLSGREVTCANKHILQVGNADVFAEDLQVGDQIDTITGPDEIINIIPSKETTFYDISIAAPHLYYDSMGIVHHNTLITATLSWAVEKFGRSIIIVPNKSLIVQTEADYINLGLDVGVYFGDRKEFGHTHTICTWQSLNIMQKKPVVNEETGEYMTIANFIEGVVCVMIDECHGVKANALKDLLTGPMAKIPIRYGLTGTIPKEDFEKVSLKCSLGDVLYKLSAVELQDQGVLAQCHVNIVQLIDSTAYNDYQAELKYLTTNVGRIEHIATIINKVKDAGNTLVLVDRIECGKMLQANLSELFSLIKDAPEVVFVSGSTKVKDRKEHYDSIATSTNQIIIATYGVAAVGLDIVRLHNLVMIEPGKSFVRVIQSIGRGLRKGHDKDEVAIYDITSTCKFSKRHLAKRKKFYTAAEYPYTINKVHWQK